MRIKRFLIILIIGIVILFSVIGWMAWKGYQLQKGEVIIITDKTDYEGGEILKVKIRNNFRENICFSSCYPYLLERKNEKWESYKYVECHDFNGNGHCINVGKEKAFELTLPEVSDGLHRLAIPVCIGCKKEDTFREDKRFYSNEFWIRKEIVEEVTIATDETEYGLGEIVKTTVLNRLEFSIYADFWKGSWRILQYKNEQWNEIFNGRSRTIPICICGTYPDDICPQWAPPIEKFDEIKPSESIDWSWDQKVLQGTEKGCFNWIDALPGKYKVEFRHFYTLDPDKREWKTIYSNEFTIK